MKILIGFALLFVAFAADAFVLPDAPQPVYEQQVPDISPAFIAPALANLLNDLGEIPEEYLNEFGDVVFVHVADVVPFDDAFPVDAVKVVDLPAFENVAAPLEAADEVPVVPVQVADLPVAPANEDVAVDAVKVVDLPVAPANEDVAVDAVKVVDLPVAPANEAVAVDAVKVVDLPVVPANEDAAVGAVQVADLPFKSVELPKIQPPVVIQPRDGDVHEEQEAAFKVDSVLVADAPVEEPAQYVNEEVPAFEVDSVLLVDSPVEISEDVLPNDMSAYMR